MIYIRSKYTLELRQIDNTYNVFNFEYDFYTDNEFIKNKFERKFIDEYYFNEIGFETVGRFQHRLKTKLNNIMPYYKELYRTQLESENINFMLNKDLKETFEREVIGENNSFTDATSVDNSENNNKESNIDNGNASLSLDDGSITNVSNSTLTNNITSSATTNDISNQKEKTTFISQGNIGITSSAELLQKWRSIIINIDKMIIDECSNLFMQVF